MTIDTSLVDIDEGDQVARQLFSTVPPRAVFSHIAKSVRASFIRNFFDPKIMQLYTVIYK